MKIFTVRHGQTAWNLEGRMQGSMDIPLDGTGLGQAERLSERLSKEKIDIIYTSDLARAVKTAEVINSRHNAEIVPSAAIREINFGTFEGQLLSESGAELDRLLNLGQAAPGGEDVYALGKRVHNFLDKILSQNHENIVIVSHGVAIRAMIHYFLKLTLQESNKLRVGNTAIHCFERGPDGNFSMTIENCTAHLPDFD